MSGIMKRVRSGVGKLEELTRDSRAEELAKENALLRKQIADGVSSEASKSGYLHKFRGQAESTLFSAPWAMRYCLLRDGELRYYRTERDVHYPPRGQVSLAGTTLELEGRKRHRFWTLHVRDGAGVSLIRLSTEVHVDFLSWVDALTRAGCNLARREGSSDSDDDESSDEADTTAPPAAADDKGAAKPRGLGLQPSTPMHQVRRASLLSSERIALSNQNGMVTLMSLILISTNARLVLENVIKYGFRFNPITILRRALTPDGNVPLLLCWPALIFFCLAALGIERLAARRLAAELRARAAESKRSADAGAGKGKGRPPKTGEAKDAKDTSTATSSGTSDEDAGGGAVRRKGGRGKGKGAGARGASGGSGAGLSATTSAIDAIDASALPPSTARQAAATEGLIVPLILLNTSAVLLVPSAVIHFTASEPLPGFVLTTLAVVLWLKLVSYAHVNWDYREARRAGQVRPGERGSEAVLPGIACTLKYPENLTAGNLGYFLAAPTLCYQPAYPRSSRFRLRWLVRRVALLFVVLTIMAFFVEQYIGPSVDNSLQPLHDMDLLRVIERVMKLSLPTLYLWLAMFIAVFDLSLNIAAELTGFGDREFYKEWWNATTVGEYWRTWNMPVHKWMVRHVYFPCVRYGVSKFSAGLVVFFVSAVFHEILVGVPLHMVRTWSFWGIMAQVPLIALTDWLKKAMHSDRIGNAIFWVTFCFLGQPLSILLYYHDWRKEQGA